MQEAWKAESLAEMKVPTCLHLKEPMQIKLQHQLQPCIHLKIVDTESPFIFHETTFQFVICNNWKVEEIHFINFNFIKMFTFYQMVRLNYINTVSKLNPQMYSFPPQKLQNLSIILLLMFRNSCS